MTFTTRFVTFDQKYKKFNSKPDGPKLVRYSHGDFISGHIFKQLCRLTYVLKGYHCMFDRYFCGHFEYCTYLQKIDCLCKMD